MAIYPKSKRDHDLLGPFLREERGAIVVQEVIISSRKTRCRAFQMWLGYHLEGLKKPDLCLCGKGDGGKGRLCDSLLCWFSSLQFAFTHKSCVYIHKTFVARANTEPVASLGRTE